MVENRLIPPQTFDQRMTQDGAGRPSWFPGSEAVALTLQQVVRYLGITKWRLGQLVGCSYASQIYQWTGGEHRPSSLFLTRMLFLVGLQAERGLDVSAMQSINWDTGDIHWKENKRRVLETPTTKPGSGDLIPIADLKEQVG